MYAHSEIIEVHHQTIQLTLLTAIAVACRDVDVRNVKATIVGPPDTPYEFGFFDVRYNVIPINRRIGAKW